MEHTVKGNQANSDRSATPTTPPKIHNISRNVIAFLPDEHFRREEQQNNNTELTLQHKSVQKKDHLLTQRKAIERLRRGTQQLQPPGKAQIECSPRKNSIRERKPRKSSPEESPQYERRHHERPGSNYV